MTAGMAWLLVATCLVHSILRVQGYHYIGCFVDADARDLPILGGRDSMSAGRCNQLCLGRSFKYFGLQFSNECWCGNSYGRHGPVSVGECSMPCTGDQSEFCGAAWRSSLYATEATPGLHFVGCFADSSSRDLPVTAGSGSMSVRKCQEMCKSKSFAYCGVQFTNECFCGNGFGAYGAKPLGECNMRCTGDSSAMCGAAWRNSLYTTGISPLKVPAASHASQPTVRDQLAAQIQSQYVSLPDGVLCNDCLLNMWSKREVDAKTKVFPIKDLTAVMASYPAKVRDKVQVLQFGSNAKTTFEDFHIDIGSSSRAVRTSYLGMARRVNDNVELAMVAVDLAANLVPKFNVYQKKVCKKVLWVFNKCSTHTVTEPRGYHAGEITLIDRALRSETFRLFGEKLSQITV